MNMLVLDPGRLHKMRCDEIPHNLYPALLTEAITQRELFAIDYLVSTWPLAVLDVHSILPMDDFIQVRRSYSPVDSSLVHSLYYAGYMCLCNR
jgi:hypothetical protein